MTEERQSGDDTVLDNVWDEVCVQVQRQESTMWEDYVDTIRQIIKVHGLPKLAPEEQQAIWLQTNSGLGWNSDEETGEIPTDDDDIVEYILNDYVLTAAADWKNSRIEKYIERSLDE